MKYESQTHESQPLPQHSYSSGTLGGWRRAVFSAELPDVRRGWGSGLATGSRTFLAPVARQRIALFMPAYRCAISQRCPRRPSCTSANNQYAVSQVFSVPSCSHEFVNPVRGPRRGYSTSVIAQSGVAMGETDERSNDDTTIFLVSSRCARSVLGETCKEFLFSNLGLQC